MNAAQGHGAPYYPPMQGPPAQFAGPGGGYPPGYSEPPRKRRKWPWVLGILLSVMLLGFAGCAVMVGGAVTAIDDAVKADEAKRNKVVTGVIGTPVENAGMTYLVAKADTHKSLPGFGETVEPKKARSSSWWS